MEPIIVEIKISSESQPSAFTPNPEVIQPNDSVFWFNETDDTHQPAPDGGADNQWVKQPIASGKGCSQVVFQKNGAFPYHCATHPNVAREKGTITVSNLIEIRRDNGVDITFDALTVAPGSYVNWANRDNQGLQHQPVSAAFAVPAPIDPQTRSAPIQVKTAGTFDYTCKLHANEKGTLTVKVPS
jgi:plastocyanin